MKIDITIYDDNDNMLMGFYSEQANLNNLRNCAVELCNIVITENSKIEKKEKKE